MLNNIIIMPQSYHWILGLSTAILKEMVETIGNKDDTEIYTLNLNVSFITKALIGAG
jgi:hypothetical protein